MRWPLLWGVLVLMYALVGDLLAAQPASTTPPPQPPQPRATGRQVRPDDVISVTAAEAVRQIPINKECVLNAGPRPGSRESGSTVKIVTAIRLHSQWKGQKYFYDSTKSVFSNE